jgi:hypothetical protein
MTAGLFPSPDNLQSETAVPAKQDKAPSSTAQLLLPTTKTEAFAWFCLQHPHFLKFVFQCFLTGVVLCFCMIQLSHSKKEDNALYWSGITSIIAWWMPSPGSGKNSSSDRSSEP